MDNNEILREIADELHNVNINLVELINVLKKNGPRAENKISNESDEILETLTEAMSAHQSQLEAKRNEATPARIEAENEYQRRQANFDQALKKLGIMT